MKFLLVFLLLKSAICQFVVPDPGQINAIVRGNIRQKPAAVVVARAHAAPPPQMMNMAQITNLNVDCEKSGMTVKVDFSQNFDGVIYSKGHYSDQSCRYVDANSGRGSYTFHIERGMCGAQLIEDMDNHEFTITNTIILQMDPLIQEIWDQAQRLTCSWKTRQTKNLKFRPLSISTLEAVNTQINADGIKCWMEIMKGVYPQVSSIGDVVAIGEPLSLMVYATNTNAPVDIAIRDCWAYAESDFNDPTTAKLQLASENGCILKPKLMEEWKKTYIMESRRKILLTYAKISAFKFPDEPDMHITCNIEICTGKCEEKCLPNISNSRDIDNNTPKFLNSNTTPKILNIYTTPKTSTLSTTPKVDSVATPSNIIKDTTTSRVIKVTTLLASKQTTSIPRRGNFNSNIKQNKKCSRNSKDPGCLVDCFPGTSNSGCRVNCEIDPFNPSCKRGKSIVTKAKESGRQICLPGSQDPLCWNVLIRIDSSESKIVCSPDSRNPICLHKTTIKPSKKLIHDKTKSNGQRNQLICSVNPTSNLCLTNNRSIVKKGCQNNEKLCQSGKSSEMPCILFPKSEGCLRRTNSHLKKVKQTSRPPLRQQNKNNCYPGSLQPECFYLSKGNPYKEDIRNPVNCDHTPYHISCSSFYVKTAPAKSLNCLDHGINCNSRREEKFDFCKSQPNNPICQIFPTFRPIDLEMRCKPGEICVDRKSPDKQNNLTINYMRGYCNRYPNNPSCRSQITKLPHKDIPPLICYPESKDSRCLLSSNNLHRISQQPNKSFKVEQLDQCYKGSTNPKCIHVGNRGKSLIVTTKPKSNIEIHCNPNSNRHCKEEELAKEQPKVIHKCSSSSSDPNCIAKSNIVIINRPSKIVKCSPNSQDPNCKGLTNTRENIRIACANGSKHSSCIETIQPNTEKEDSICKRWPNIPRCRSGFIPPPPFIFKKSPCIYNPNLPGCTGEIPNQNEKSKINCARNPTNSACRQFKEESLSVNCKGPSDKNCIRIVESPKLVKQDCELNPFQEGCSRLKIIEMINKLPNPLCIFGSTGKGCNEKNIGKRIITPENPCFINPTGIECHTLKHNLEKSNNKLCELNPNDVRCKSSLLNKESIRSKIDCAKNPKSLNCVEKSKISSSEKCSPGSTKSSCRSEGITKCMKNPLSPECKLNVNTNKQIIRPKDGGNARRVLCERYRNHPLCLRDTGKHLQIEKIVCIPGSMLPHCLELSLPKESQHSKIDCQHNTNHVACRHRLNEDIVSCNKLSTDPKCKQHLNNVKVKNNNSKTDENCSPGNPGCSPKVEERLKLKITCPDGSPGPLCNTGISNQMQNECSAVEHNCVGGIRCYHGRNHVNCCNKFSTDPKCKQHLNNVKVKNNNLKTDENCSPGIPGCSPKVEERLKLKITCANGSPGPLCNTGIPSQMQNECSAVEHNCVGGIRCYHGRNHVNCRKKEHAKGTVVNCITHPFHYTCIREKELRGKIPPHRKQRTSTSKPPRRTTERPSVSKQPSTLPTPITTAKSKKPPCFPGSTDPVCSLYHLGHLCIREPTNPKCQPAKPKESTDTDKDREESKKVPFVTSTTSKPEKIGKQLTKKKMPKDDFHGDISPRYHAFHSWLYNPAPRPRNRGIRGRRSVLHTGP